MNYFDISLQHGQDYYQIKSIIPDVEGTSEGRSKGRSKGISQRASKT